jgi:hypothetical protein
LNRPQIFQHLPLAKDWASAIALALAIGGGVLAVVSLHKNTISLRGSIRGQIYAEDRQLSKREVDDSTGTIYSVYTDYPSKGVPTIDYVQARLKPFVPADTQGTYTRFDTAEALQTALWGDATFTVDPQASAAKLKELRRAALHIEEYFNHVAAIYDYKEDGVITPGEWRTWKAWLKDVNTHPLLMLAIYGALENGYVDRRFAVEARDAICQGDADNQRILKEFLGPVYGPALMDDHLDFLAEYNK